MKDLAAIFSAAGCSDVATYIQSGNVVFRATDACARKLAGVVAKKIFDELGFEAPVVLRSVDELHEVAQNNPFLRKDSDFTKLHVAFLADEPKPAAVAALDPKKWPGDELVVKGRDIYLHFPNGVGGSKLTNNYLDRTLQTVSTIRGWKTILKLVELSSALE